MIEQGISAAERIGDLSAMGIMSLITLASVYILYKFIVREHHKVMDTLDQILLGLKGVTHAIETIIKVQEKTNDLMTGSSERVFSIAIDRLSEINRKLDSLQAEKKREKVNNAEQR